MQREKQAAKVRQVIICMGISIKNKQSYDQKQEVVGHLIQSDESKIKQKAVNQDSVMHLILTLMSLPKL